MNPANINGNFISNISLILGILTKLVKATLYVSKTHRQVIV